MQPSCINIGRMNRKIIGIFLIAIITIIAALVLKNNTNSKIAASPSAPRNDTSASLSVNKLKVTTSFYPLYFFATQIAGNNGNVKNITPAGAEPHDYEPTAQDIARIEKSDLLILNGGVEAWGDKIKDNLKDKNVEIIVAGDGLLNQQLTEQGKIAQDPHIWLDPTLAKKEVEKIKDGFIKKDPNNSSYYETNTKQLEDKLGQLDNTFKQGLSNCEKKDLVTSHAAFGYLASRYGLNQVPISGLSPDQEPSPKQLADVSNFAKKNNIKYIFFESLVSPKLSETIANEVGAKTLVLDPLEGLSDDEINKFATSQGSVVKSGKDYFSVMQDNLKNLQVALVCKTT